MLISVWRAPTFRETGMDVFLFVFLEYSVMVALTQVPLSTSLFSWSN